MKIYDFVHCDGDAALQDVIGTINQNGYELISVTQQEHTYTVFFRRPADG
jgi:hypothetical protein